MKALRLKTHYFHTKLPYQKPMLRQTERWVKNRSITKNAVLPVPTSFCWRFCFSLRTSHKELIWCSNDPNVHIRTFCKRCSIIWRCFFPLSMLKKEVWEKLPLQVEEILLKYSFELQRGIFFVEIHILTIINIFWKLVRKMTYWLLF